MWSLLQYLLISITLRLAEMLRIELPMIFWNFYLVLFSMLLKLAL